LSSVLKKEPLVDRMQAGREAVTAKPIASADGKEVVYRGKDKLGRTYHKDDDGLFTSNPRKKSDE
jgi:hypothetical protein